MKVLENLLPVIFPMKLPDLNWDGLGTSYQPVVNKSLLQIVINVAMLHALGGLLSRFRCKPGFVEHQQYYSSAKLNQQGEPLQPARFVNALHENQEQVDGKQD